MDRKINAHSTGGYNAIPSDSLLPSKLRSEGVQWGAQTDLKRCAYFLLAFQALLLVLFGAMGGKQELTSGEFGTGTQGYNMFIGVEIMMFIGFGYLMTFLKWYGFGAVGLTMLVTAIGLQWYLFVNHWFYSMVSNEEGDWNNVPVNIYNMCDALFGIGAILISFGGLIGKISPFQLILLTIIELALHAFNFRVLLNHLVVIKDLGGTYVVHMFGAYFGLTVAYFLGKPMNTEPEGSYVSDMFSFIGTLFLWIYWPSFVAAEGGSDTINQQQAIVNTILSLCASTLVTFALSVILSHKIQFRPVDMQNATLAGGVAIGCVANLGLSAYGAAAIGCMAGALSCYGFNVIQPYLCNNFGLHDTCGIHNLHAMPSVLGACCSVVVLMVNSSDSTLWWSQFVGIVICLAFAIGTGAITGMFLKNVVSSQDDNLKTAFQDDLYWECAADYHGNPEAELATKA